MRAELRLLYAAPGADSPDTPHTVTELTLSDGRLCIVVFSPSTNRAGIVCGESVEWTTIGEQAACDYARSLFDAQYRAQREAEERERELLAGDDW